MLRRSLIVALLPCLAPLPAQAGGPALLVKTADPGWANPVLEFFDYSYDLPALGQDMYWQLALDDGGRLQVKTRRGMLGTVEFVVRPGPLLDLYDEQLSSAVGVAQGTFAMAVGQAGIRTKEAIALFRTAFEFPRQIALARLRIEGDFARIREGVEMQLWLDPVAETWFDRLTKSVKPSLAKAPDLDDSSAAVTLQVITQLDGAAEAVKPISDFLSRIGTRDKQEVSQRIALLDRYWNGLDGTMSMSWDLTSGMTILTGLEDGDAVRALYQDPQFVAWLKNPLANSRALEIEFTPDALTHREVSLYKQVTIPDDRMTGGRPNPFFGEEVVGYGGVAGDYLIGTVGMRESGVKAIVDKVLDRGFRRSALGGMIIARLKVRVADMIEAATQGAVPSAQMPKTMTLEIGNGGASMFLRVKTK